MEIHAAELQGLEHLASGIIWLARMQAVMVFLALCRLLPVINTEDAWKALRGHFELDSPVKVRVHKVMPSPLP